MGLPTAQEFSEILAWTLLHFFWQGLLIGVLYAVGKQVSDSVRWQHGIGLISLGLVLASPAVTLYWLLAQTAAAGEPVGTVAQTVLAGTSAVAAFVDGGADGAGSWWTYGLVGIWLLGSVVVGSRLVRDWHEVRRAIRESAEPSLELLAMFGRQMRRIGVSRNVRLRLTDRITTPAVYGFLRPIVLLPTALALGLPRDQLETLLTHELAHIRRADFLANTLALVARTLFYFHPVVHWICRDLERTRETLCDDLVVELKCDRLKYARALSTVEHFRQKIPVPLLTAVGGELTSRVHRILEIDSQKPRENGRAPLLIAAAAILATVAGMSGMTTEQLAAARPEFRAVYGALMGSGAPVVAAPEIPRAQLLATPTIIAMPADPVIDRPLPTVAPQIDKPMALAGPEAMDAPIVEPQKPSAAAFDPDMGAIENLEITDADQFDIAPLLSSETEPAQALADPSAHQATIEPVTAPAPANPPIDMSPHVKRHVRPTYPTSALRYGIEGSVTLSYRVNARGVATDVKVETATSPGTFEKSSLDAFKAWRFEPPASSSSRYTQVFNFNLEDQSGDHRCIRRTGSSICRGSSASRRDE